MPTNHNRTRLAASDRCRVATADGVTECTITSIDGEGTVTAKPLGGQPVRLEAPKPRNKRGKVAEPQDALPLEELIVPHASSVDPKERPDTPHWFAFHPDEKLEMHGSVARIEHISHTAN